MKQRSKAQRLKDLDLLLEDDQKLLGNDNKENKNPKINTNTDDAIDAEVVDEKKEPTQENSSDQNNVEKKEQSIEEKPAEQPAAQSSIKTDGKPLERLTANIGALIEFLSKTIENFDQSIGNTNSGREETNSSTEKQDELDQKTRDAEASGETYGDGFSAESVEYDKEMLIESYQFFVKKGYLREDALKNVTGAKNSLINLKKALEQIQTKLGEKIPNAAIGGTDKKDEEQKEQNNAGVKQIATETLAGTAIGKFLIGTLKGIWGEIKREISSWTIAGVPISQWANFFKPMVLSPLSFIAFNVNGIKKNIQQSDAAFWDGKPNQQTVLKLLDEYSKNVEPLKKKLAELNKAGQTDPSNSINESNFKEVAQTLGGIFKARKAFLEKFAKAFNQGITGSSDGSSPDKSKYVARYRVACFSSPAAFKGTVNIPSVTSDKSAAGNRGVAAFSDTPEYEIKTYLDPALEEVTKCVDVQTTQNFISSMGDTYLQFNNGSNELAEKLKNTESPTPELISDILSTFNINQIIYKVNGNERPPLDLSKESAGIAKALQADSKGWDMLKQAVGKMNFDTDDDRKKMAETFAVGYLLKTEDTNKRINSKEDFELVKIG